MSQLIFVLGGARSGKSCFAESLVQKIDKQQVYIATAMVSDQEMATRIEIHRSRRDVNWTVFEIPIDLDQGIQKESRKDRVILVDCLTLWLGNLLHFKKNVVKEFDKLLSTLKKKDGDIILVANEVGQSVIPNNIVARSFRDYAGFLNIAIGAIANRVYFVVAGLPLVLKEE